MITSKERLNTTLAHKTPDKIPIDFGSTTVSGIHCKIVESLRKYYGLAYKPVKIVEPYQMLGEVDDELMEIIGIDTLPVFSNVDMFGIEQEHFREQTTPWGQVVLMPEKYDMTPDAEGSIYVYPQGDRRCRPSGVMPQGCFFFNAVERQPEIHEEELNADDNNEEYGLISEDSLSYFEQYANKVAATGKALVASFGGTALGDVAVIPGLGLKNPKGIRSVMEWYMSTVTRQDLIHEMYAKQIDIAIANYKRLWERIGSKVDVVYLCGADFGTQESQFCSADAFRSLWLPHYKKMTDWIHQNTTWKVFKHSCGSIVPLLPAMIDAGFDIINPVQINAKGMDPVSLKEEFGNDVVFWGGGIDTQVVLPSATPEEVRTHVLRQCEIMGRHGGFVFNSVHNVQANVPIENLVAAINAVHEYNGMK
jgi:hypothetical protein